MESDRDRNTQFVQEISFHLAFVRRIVVQKSIGALVMIVCLKESSYAGKSKVGLGRTAGRHKPSKPSFKQRGELNE